MSFEKITKVSLPFDMRHTDSGKDYGVHGLDIWFILKGEKGAVQFMVNFPVHLPHVQKEFDRKAFGRNEITGYDVGYHALTAQYEDQHTSNCDLFEGKKCFYDGSGLRAQEWVDEIFSITGKRLEDEIWSRLETEYKERFEAEEK